MTQQFQKFGYSIPTGSGYKTAEDLCKQCKKAMEKHPKNAEKICIKCQKALTKEKRVNMSTLIDKIDKLLIEGTSMDAAWKKFEAVARKEMGKGWDGSVTGEMLYDGKLSDKAVKLYWNYYEKIKTSKNEMSVVGGSYIAGTTINVIGSGQTRAVGDYTQEIDIMQQKEPYNKLAVKFNKILGAFVPREQQPDVDLEDGEHEYIE